MANKYLFIVSMDVAPEKEALFNEIYEEHIRFIKAVPGVGNVTRWKTEPAAFVIAGERKPLEGTGMARYTAHYELDSPDILVSKEWGVASEQGRWAAEIRPHTFNRSHVVRKAV